MEFLFSWILIYYTCKMKNGININITSWSIRSRILQNHINFRYQVIKVLLVTQNSVLFLWSFCNACRLVFSSLYFQWIFFIKLLKQEVTKVETLLEWNREKSKNCWIYHLSRQSCDRDLVCTKSTMNISNFSVLYRVLIVTQNKLKFHQKLSTVGFEPLTSWSSL